MDRPELEFVFMIFLIVSAVVAMGTIFFSSLPRKVKRALKRIFQF